MISVIVYGGFRSFELNLKRNIEELLGELSVPVHIYILSEECDNYNTKKSNIVNLIESYGYEIKYFESINSCKFYNKHDEDVICNDYYNIEYNGIRDDFTPRLYYRKCLINKIMNSFNILYDKVIYARLFDTIIKRFKSLHFINDIYDNNVYYSMDTILISKMEQMNILLSSSLISDIIYIEDSKLELFKEYVDKYDHYLAQTMPKLASEIFYYSIVFNKLIDTSKNLRYDFTKGNIINWNSLKSADDIINAFIHNVKDDYLLVLLCPFRK
jgi:hypothetical protein